MQVAIVGAGFCGLGVAWKLIEKSQCRVTIFDPKGIGGGASGIASGLIHPYPGEQGKRSWRADLAMEATRTLLQQVESGGKVCHRTGIIRYAQDREMANMLQSHALQHGDVEPLGGDAFFIRSGLTIHCRSYLDGLWRRMEAKGAILMQESVDDLRALASFDVVVIAAGAASTRFAECSTWPVRRTKGQVLSVFSQEAKLEKSLIGKGYVALGEGSGEYLFGSTYERGYVSEEPDLSVAKGEILPKIVRFFPEARDCSLVDCRAGMRLSRIGHYYPIVKRLDGRTWALSAMGSRGLLYHAYCAELLAEAILAGDGSGLPEECQ